MKKTAFRRGMAALLCLLLLSQSVPLAAAQNQPSTIPITADYFPDPEFRRWLMDPANLNGAGTDGIFTQEELADIHMINVSSQDITSLKGIESFYALEQLSCKNNALTELDVQNNRALNYLQCDSNRISSLDVSGLENLQFLYCEHNRMTALDLTGCTSLELIYCRNNDLQSLDFSSNLNLKFIEAFDNQLEQIDLSMLSKLEFVHLDHNRLTHLDLSQNTSLTSVGSGFVARNNYLETLTLPNRPGQVVDWDVYLEQDPKIGYERVEWYYDLQFTQPAEEFTPADGRTLYAKWLPNDYTILFHAGGGVGSMPPQTAVWDTPLTLPAQLFHRTGYVFDAWENTYGDGARYQDGAQVKNLAGRKQGDRVTLYAQWEPVTYTVSFDAGSGSGTMDATIHTYDQEKALPPCTLMAPAGLEFVGWARSMDGPVIFRDQASVRNLASHQDDNVILYAVWGVPLLNQYLERLDAIHRQYDSAEYTLQDWSKMEKIYTLSVQALLSAESTEEMVRICQHAEEAMKGVSDIARRIQHILDLWAQENQSVLALADRGAVRESGAHGLLEAARSASEALSERFITERTDLTIPGDQMLLAELAREAARSQLDGLDRLAAAAAWAGGLDGLSLRPMAEVSSQDLSTYESALAQAASHADQLHADLTDGLQARAALALCKQQSAAALLTAYQSYDLEQYSQQAQAQMETIWRQATRAIEAAASEDSIAALLNGALQDLRDVPVQKPGSQPDGDGSGGTTEKPVTPPGDTDQQPSWENPYSDVSHGAWYYTSVEYVSANGIMNGYRDGTFGPHYKLSRAQLAQLLYNLEGQPDAAAVRYKDTEEGAWYESAIRWASTAGILTGYADGSVRPNVSVTRQQLATMLYRYAQYKDHDLSVRADLDDYHDAAQISPYALEALQWANGAGIVNGSGNALLPHNTATRAQTAAMLTRFCTK